MARTTINTQVIPDGTIVSADLSYPLTDFSSTGIDDNATSTAITIDASENVGIGATSPSSKAHIKGDLRIEDATDTTSRDHIISIDTTGALTFDDSVSGERMRVDWNGNVGIGISAPTEKLTVKGDVTLTPNSTSAADRLAALTIGKRDSGTVDYMGQIDFVGSGTNGFATDIVFSSKTGDFYNSTTNEHMRIDSSGSVKIGNSSAGGTMLGISDGAFDGTNYGSVQVVKPLDHDNVWHYSMVQAGNQIGGMGFYDNLASTMVVGIGAGPTLASASQHVYQSSILQSYVGGTERMRIDSSGNVGIGTTDPDARLDVKASTATVEVAARFRKGSTADTGGHTMLIGLGTEDAAWSKSAIGHQRNAPYDVGDLIFCLNNDAASGSDVSTSYERMRITSSGKILQGKTTSSNIGTQPWAFQQEGNSFSTTGLATVRNSNDIYGSYFVLGKSRGTTAGAVTACQSGDELGTILWAGADGSDMNGQPAGIAAIAASTFTSNNTPGHLVFRTTASGASAATERMRIDSSGDVGIGTTDPIAKQHNLITSSGTALLLNNSAGGSGQYVDLDFNTYNVGVSGYANAAATIRVIDDGAFSGNITFRTKGASVGASQTERMRIDTSGNLLVGTTSTPTSATSQVFADNTKRYYFATKQIASGSTTSFFKITIAGANTRNVVDFELETASTSPSHGSSSMTSGQIILTRGKFDTNVRITTVINGTATTGAGGFVALTSSGSGNDATFTLQLQSYSPTHDQTCNIHIYSRATNIAVVAV